MGNYGMIFVGLLIGAVVLFLLTLVPNKLRKPLIAMASSIFSIPMPFAVGKE